MELLWTNHITPQSLNLPIHIMETKTHAFQTKCFKVCKEKSLYSSRVPRSFSTDSCTILAFSKFLKKKVIMPSSILLPQCLLITFKGLLFEKWMQRTSFYLMCSTVLSWSSSYMYSTFCCLHLWHIGRNLADFFTYSLQIC